MKYINFKKFVLVTNFLLGAVLHIFCEDFSNNELLYVFVPVRNSIWENLKPFYWSFAVSSFAEYLFLKETDNNFFIARLIETFLGMSLSCCGFYICLYYYGELYISAKIIIFILNVSLIYIISYKTIEMCKFENETLNIFAVMFLLILAICFAALTFKTPNWYIFKEF